jgi:predicted nuclease with TOPRIM domain
MNFQSKKTYSIFLGLLFFCLAGIFGCRGFKSESERLKEEITDISTENNKLRKELSTLKAENSSMHDRLAQLNLQISELQNEMQTLKKDLDSLKAQVKGAGKKSKKT